MRTYTIFLFTLFIFHFGQSSAQNLPDNVLTKKTSEQSDSLRSIASDFNFDFDKEVPELVNQYVETLLKRADFLKRQGRPELSWQSITQAEKISQTQNNPTQIAQTLSAKANWYSYFSKRDTAFTLAKQTLEYAEKHQLTEIIPEYMVQAGFYALELPDFDAALKYCTTAQSLAEKQNLNLIYLKCEACVKDAAGRFAYEFGHFRLKEVLDAYGNIIDAVLEKGDTVQYLRYWGKYADLYRSVGSLDTFQMMINEVAQLLKRHPDISLAMTVNTMQSVYESLNENYEAEEFYIRKALKISQSNDLFSKRKQHYYCRLKENYAARGLWDKAIEVLDSANMIEPKVFQEGADSYAYLYKEKGDYETAVKYYDKWVKNRDSLLQFEMMSFVTEWEAKYENQKKELLLAKERNRQRLLIIFLALATVFGFFLFRAFRDKQKINKELILQKNTVEAQAKELRQLDKMKSRFFANVSHELRTPLTLILGPISSALKSGDLTNRNFTLLKKAQQSGQDLLKLIGSILDLSKMESGKLELNEEPELLFNLTRRIISAFESHAQREGIRFGFNYQAEKSLQLLMDKEKLETILNNLLSNAIKFTPKGGEITVNIQDLGNTIQIEVKDTGRGIHPDDLPNVFNRFYQSAQPNAPTEGGTGIGLALSQELVQLMNGKIRVESELGEGSRFIVEFPLKEILGMVDSQTVDGGRLTVDGLDNGNYPPNEIFNTVKKSQENNTSHSHPLTVLIVEDNHSLREYIQTILEPHYQVLTAENGAVALEILSEPQTSKDSPSVEPSTVHRPPSIVISDIMMPVMDGYQLLSHLKSSDDFRSIPVIMLTARAEIQDKLKALRIGVDDYLLKPFEEEELLVRIENLLENRANRDAFLMENESTPDPENRQEKISEENQNWLKELETFLMTQIGNSNYSLSEMSTRFAMSESTFTRQLKRLTGLTPIRYFQELRLNEARRILENREFRTITNVAYKIGFKDANAFSRAFKKRFGKSPSDFINN